MSVQATYYGIAGPCVTLLASYGLGGRHAGTASQWLCWGGVDTMLIAVDPVDKAVPSQLDLGH